MQDINSVLKLFKNESSMNYCTDFDVLKGILEYCNENLKLIEKIQFRGGNDKFIENLVTRILRHFSEKSYIDENNCPRHEYDCYFRKITFFLALNTDCTYKYNLNDDPNLCNCLNTVPQLTKCLLVNLIWELKLDKYFYEILMYTPSWFAFQFCEPSVQSLKHVEQPYNVLQKVDSLLKAIFGNMCRSEMRVIDSVDQKIIFNRFYDFSMDLLRQFYTPDAEKFAQFTKMEFFKYSGYALYHLLDIILYCFDGYEGICDTTYNTKYDIYEICKNVYPVNELKLAQHSELIQEHQKRIIVSLLNSLQFNVMLVTIDVFVSWVEVNFNPNLTLQACIGERAYRVLERMSNNITFGHDVDQQLKFLAIRPKTLEEIVIQANIGEILTNIETVINFDHKRRWFAELFSRPSAFGNDECLDTINAHIKLVTVKNITQLFEYLKQEFETVPIDENALMEVENPVEERIVQIFIRSLQNFDVQELAEVSLYGIKTFGKDFNYFELPHLELRCVEFFNRHIHDFDIKQFLCYALENPQIVWSKFYDEACSSRYHLRNYCRCLRITTKLGNIYFEPVFYSSFATNNCNMLYFPDLIAEVYFTIYQHKKVEFFRNFINKNCTDFLNSEQWDDLLPILKALRIIAHQSLERTDLARLNFGEVTAPVLLMAAQVMDKCRWDLLSYCEVREEIVRTCIDFIQSVSSRFLPIATERDRQWITKVIKKSYRPFTQYYFQKFTLPIGERQQPFDIFLYSEESDTVPEIEKFLLSTFVRCTARETEMLAKSHKLLPHISNVMLLLNGIIMDMSDANVLQLYQHCMSNYAKVVHKFLIPKPGPNQRSSAHELGFNVLHIINVAPISCYDEIFMYFYDILLDIFRIANRPNDDDLVRDLTKYMSTMKNCKGKEIFQEKFHAFVAAEKLN